MSTSDDNGPVSTSVDLEIQRSCEQIDRTEADDQPMKPCLLYAKERYERMYPGWDPKPGGPRDGFHSVKVREAALYRKPKWARENPKLVTHFTFMLDDTYLTDIDSVKCIVPEEMITDAEPCWETNHTTNRRIRLTKVARIDGMTKDDFISKVQQVCSPKTPGDALDWSHSKLRLHKPRKGDHITGPGWPHNIVRAYSPVYKQDRNF